MALPPDLVERRAGGSRDNDHGGVSLAIIAKQNRIKKGPKKSVLRPLYFPARVLLRRTGSQKETQLLISSFYCLGFWVQRIPTDPFERDGEPSLRNPNPSEKTTLVNWDARFLRAGCPIEKNLQERFARETGDDFPGRVAHAHDLLPIFRRRRRSDGRADRDGDVSATRKPGAVPQRAPCPVESDGHDHALRRDRRLERAEMKRTHAGL